MSRSFRSRLVPSLLLVLSLGALAPRLATGHGAVAEPIAALARAIQSRPDDAGLYIARAELWRRGGDLARAGADLDAAERLAPGHRALALCRAAVAVDAQQPALARPVLDRALAGEVDDPRLLVLRARVLAALGETRAAVADFDRAVTLAARPTPELLIDRARLQVELGDREGALRGLDEARGRVGRLASLELFAIDLELAAGRPEAANLRVDALAPQYPNRDALTGVRSRIAAATRGERTMLAASPAPTAAARLTTDGLAQLRPAPLSAAAAARAAGPARADEALAQVLRGPYLQVATPDAMTVRWRTDVVTDSYVRYGTDPDFLTTIASDGALLTEHEIRLTGLTPDTRYYYSVGDASGPLATHLSFTFVTPPPVGPAKATRIWIVGDSGQPGANANAVRNAYAAWTGERGTDLWLMLGDNAYNSGTDTEYEAAVFDQYTVMLRQAVLWPTRGNHDVLYGGPANDYYDIFTMPMAGEAGGLASGSEAYYSFDRANVHYVCLDSEGSSLVPGSPMFIWLANDLAANTHPWVVVFFHHPPYTKGSHDSDDPGDSFGKMRDMRQNALPILEAGGADLVLTGHSHSYERSMLLNGHYDVSGTLTPAMRLDAGNGQPNGDGPYLKPSNGPAANEGAVYAVAGSSSKTESSGATLNHPAMVRSLLALGSMAVDITGLHLEARFIDNLGAVRDSFVIDHGGSVDVTPGVAAGLRLGPGLPNPFALDTRIHFTMPSAGRARLSVVGADGRRIATLIDGWVEGGPHEARWDGRDATGHDVPAGVFFSVLEADGQRVSRKLALVR